MFRQIRYQTGEIKEIVEEMKKGSIPCMDLNDYEELEWFVGQLAEHGIFRVEGMPYDKNARDRIKEPEFEFRIPFHTQPVKAEEAGGIKLLYLDVYFEPDYEESYDPVGEM